MSGIMGELTGGLIQMNAKMIMSGPAEAMVIAGVLLGALALTAAVMWWFDAKKRWWAWLLAALLAAGVAYLGDRLPREKIIHACASGPVSLERIAAVYDIVEIDGKELVLRER